MENLKCLQVGIGDYSILLVSCLKWNPTMLPSLVLNFREQMIILSQPHEFLNSGFCVTIPSS